MARICHYQHLTWRLRRERGLPKLRDCNDLPEEGVTGVTTGAAVRRTDAEKGILTPADEKLRDQFEMKEKLHKDTQGEESDGAQKNSLPDSAEPKLAREAAAQPIVDYGRTTPNVDSKTEKVIEDDADSSSIGSGSAAPSSIRECNSRA